VRTLKKTYIIYLGLLLALTFLYLKGGVIGQTIVGLVLSSIVGIILAILFYFLSGDYKQRGQRAIPVVEEKPERITPTKVLRAGIIMVMGSIVLSFILPNIEEQVLPLINLGMGALGIIFIFSALPFYSETEGEQNDS
jgi:uncharacterized protein YacL